jgi:hypothetical protein
MLQYVISTAAYAVMYSWWWAWWRPETCKLLKIKAKIIQLYLVGYIYTYLKYVGMTNHLLVNMKLVVNSRITLVSLAPCWRSFEKLSKFRAVNTRQLLRLYSKSSYPSLTVLNHSIHKHEFERPLREKSPEFRVFLLQFSWALKSFIFPLAAPH